MSLYRSLLAVVAAVAIASPVFADDTTPTSTESTTPATQTTDTSSSVSQSASDPQTTKVNINTASVKELMKVKGLNASKARSIVAYRKKHGDFKSIQDLANVKGFKKVNLDDLENSLTVE